MFSSIGFTFLTFFTGGLSWWGPHFIEDALKFRNQTLSPDDVSSDPSVEKLENILLHFFEQNII